MHWTRIYHLGDLPLTLAAGGAIAAWLLAGGERRAALRWLLAFGLALGVVGASKIAYLGWGTGIPALHVKALSGHAAGFAATCPVLCRLLARRWRPPARQLAGVAAVAAAIVVAVALVVAREHTPAEALGGWLVGMAASLSTVRTLAALPGPADRSARHCALLACVLCAGITVLVPAGYWMMRVALVLSGKPAPTPWARGTEFTTKPDRRQACSADTASVSPGIARTRSTKDRRIPC